MPLDAARDDAAPGSGGTTAPGPGGGGQGSGGGSDGGGSGEGSAGGDAGGETEASNYRSENNFGSSSEVPGASGMRVGAGEERAPAAGSAGGEGGGAGGSIDTEPLSAPAEDTGNTSVAGSLALLATIGVLAAVLGIVLSRRRFRTR